MSVRAAKPTYVFPILKLSEINLILGELNISVSPEELEKPKAHTVRMIMETLIEYCMGLAPDDLEAEELDTMDAFQYPELHTESVGTLNYYIKCRRLLQACGVEDCSVRDLTKPDPKRLRRNLSAIINFAKFREDRMGMYAELTAEAEKMEADRDRLADEHDERKRELEDLRSLRDSQRPEREAVLVECGELEAEIAELNRTQAVMKHETNEYKAETHATQDALNETEASNAELRLQIEAVSAQVVSSPDRLRGEVAELAAQMEEEKAVQAEVEAQRRELIVQSEAVSRAEEAVEMALSLAQAVGGEAERFKKACDEVSRRKGQLESVGVEQGEVEAEEQHIKRSLARLEDRSADWRVTAARNKTVYQQALAAAKAELESLSEETAAARELQADAASKMETMNKHIEEARSKHHETMEAGRAQLAAAREAAAEHHSKLRSALAALGPRAPAARGSNAVEL
jgi:kinetochore protein Nuf2